MTDVFLYQGEANPSDVKLRDPTVVAGPTIVETEASASGVADAAGNAAAVWVGIGSSDGVATVSGISALVLPSIGASDGVGAAAGITVAILPSDGASAGVASDAVLSSAVWAIEAASAGVAEALAESEGGAEVAAEAQQVGGGIPARKRRRRYIMPDDSVVYATTEEVIDLLRLYAVPVAEVKVEKQRSVQITMPQIVLEKRDVRFLPGAAPDTWRAVINERFAYQPPPEATRQAQNSLNRIRADEEAIVLLM